MAAIARRQWGLVTAAQLAEVGLSDSSVAYRARTGRLHRVHRGVYAVGHRAASDKRVLHAAVLAVGADAAVSHWSAAVTWGLVRDDPPSDRTRIEVVTTRRVVSRERIRVHFTRHLPREDVDWPYAIPTTTPLRTLMDIASCVPGETLLRAVRQAEVDRLVDFHALAKRLSASPRRKGSAALRKIIELGPAPTRSPLEDRTLALIRRGGLPPPQINARLRVGGRAYEVDFLFPEQRVIVEADGDEYHGTRLARKADAARQAALEDAGYRVLRLTWDQVNKHDAQTVRRIRRALSGPADART